MVITFHYKVLPDKFTNGSKKPIVEIVLEGRGRAKMKVIGLLDSGADVSVIPRGLGDVLNLKLGKKESSKGIGGEIPVWNSKMKVGVKQNHEDYKFDNVPVQVSEDDTMPIIIGRRGFFDQFEIIINEDKETVKLKRRTNIISR